jgi:cytochrome c oxidase assembly protein subunit 15
MVGGIFYEHGHRMIASLVGLLTVILSIWIWRRESRRWLRVLGLVAVGAVVVQGALGGLTVLLLLPTAVSASHATLAQTFFCIVCSIAFFTSKWWLDTEKTLNVYNDRSMITYCIIVTCMIYSQLILGAVMRHTDSGLAVPDFPLAYGKVIPSLSDESIAQYNTQLIHDDVRLAADGAITRNQIVIHLLHRFWGLLTAGAVILVALRLRKQAISAATMLSRILLFVTIVQLSLGAWTVLSHKSVPITTAHVATGAFLLVCTVLTTLAVARQSGRYLIGSVGVNTIQEKFA